ncbi:MAG: glycosyltransferase [Bacteroidota bacterium]
MRIALIHYRLILKGGLETRLRNYVYEFHARGYGVTIICAKLSEEVELPNGVEVVRLSPGLTPKPFRKWRFSNLVDRYLTQHKFDFSLSLGRTTGQDAVLAAANHKGYMKAMGKRFWKLTDYMQNHLDKASFVSSQVIYAASEMMKKELIEFYNIPSGKIEILFPPINLEKIRYDSRIGQSNEAEKPTCNPNKQSFLFVSIGHKRKGLDILLETFMSLDPDRYELFIAGLPKVNPKLPHVYYIGFKKNLAPWFRAVDYTIHPARFEPFGQIVTESLACGTPILVSGMVGASEIIAEGEGVILDSLDPNDWLDLIKNLHNIDFKVADNAVEKKALGLKEHIDRMLKIWAESK